MREPVILNCPYCGTAMEVAADATEGQCRGCGRSAIIFECPYCGTPMAANATQGQCRRCGRSASVPGDMRPEAEDASW